MTEYSLEKYKSAGIAWSSEMYTLADNELQPEKKNSNPKSETDKENGFIYQNIQWAQMSEDQIYCKIIEFEVIWP